MGYYLMEDEPALTDEEAVKPKPLKWIGSSKQDLKDFPDAVQKPMGHALYLAQRNHER